MFGYILIAAVTLLNFYVYKRASGVPFIVHHLPKSLFTGISVGLWLLFVLGRIYGHEGQGKPAVTSEFLGMNWMAVLFLMAAAILAADIITGFGWLLPRLAPSLRGVALIVAMVLSAIGFFQGSRSPVVTEYDVRLPGLPQQLDGTVLVALSDLHLGTQRGAAWLAARIAQVQALRPDMVVLLGDVFEGHGAPDPALIPILRQISKPPMGAWAVLGNHEQFHGGVNAAPFIEAGFRVLRDEWAQVQPGLVVAGVDDLTNHRRQGQNGDPVAKALADLPPSGTIFLSHTPWQADQAASAGAGLMLSGHTHGGQIWPFSLLARLVYPFVEGRYEVGSMSIIVCRGTGLWGPNMRLWRPGEILRVTLRSLGSVSRK